MIDICFRGRVPSKRESSKLRLRTVGSPRITEALEPRRLLSAVQFNPTEVFTADSNVGSYVQFGGQGYFAAGASAGNFTLYRTDLTPNGTSAVSGGFTTLPNSFVRFSGEFLFLAADATHGQEIWQSDGTASGTHPLTNFSDATIAINNLTAGPDGQAFFSIPDTTLGRELWRTDGTALGTRVVKDLAAGTASSNPTPLAVLGDRFLFIASDGSHRQLFSTDGTDANTILIPAYPPNVQALGTSDTGFVTSDGRIFFAASSSAGVELWTTDGTQDGTHLVKDIYQGGDSSSPHAFAELNGKIYFAADNGSGAKLWVTDGTANGTNPAFESNPSLAGTNIGAIVSTGDRLYVAGSMLYVTDGTAGGTAKLADKLEVSDPLSNTAGLILTGDEVYFAADDSTGRELWVTQGTPENTHRVADLVRGTGSSYPHTMGTLNGKLIFNANDVEFGREPWVSDGTEAGTQLLHDTAPAPTSITIARTIAAGNVLYIFATVGSFRTNVLLATDGTREGTVLLASSVSFDYVVAGDGNRIFFGGYSGVWTSAGTPATTVTLTTDIVADPFSTGMYHNVAFAGGHFYYVKQSPFRTYELWKTDGTIQGTAAVKDTGGVLGGLIAYLQPVGQRVFFYAADPVTYGFEPWVSDGTSAGTFLLKDVNPGINGSGPNSTSGSVSGAPVGDRLFFIANDGVAHNGLWVTDGTPNGTRLVKDLVPGQNFFDSKLAHWANVGGTVFFTYYMTAGALGVWRSDGTADGTFLIFDQGFRSWPTGLAAYGNGIFLPVGPPAGNLTGWSLYRYDLTSGATTLVGSFDKVDSSPGNPVAMSDGVYFSASTPASGLEMWRTDGTPAGTEQVVDATPGTGASTVYPFYASMFRGGVWFPASGSLWVTPDVVPPGIIAASFDAAAPSGVQLQFDEGVGASIPGAQFKLINLTTNTEISPSVLHVVYDPATLLAIVTFATVGGPPLPDGDYRLSLSASSVTDASGNPLAADFTFDFFVLTGDANRDRAVNFADLVVVAQNYGGGGKTYAQGDFNGDGNVDFADLVVVAQNYGTSLPPPPAAADSATVRVTPSVVDSAMKPIFSDAPISKPVANNAKAVVRPPQRK